MSSRVVSFLLLFLFGVLASITSQFMWMMFDWLMLIQLILIFIIASVGENIVSSQGYYYYTRHDINGPFVRNVPIWILFLWIFSIQGSFLFSISLGLSWSLAVPMSGMIASMIDFLFLEPMLSRNLQLWKWTPVRKGYFAFIPAKLNRFTAPTGNYVAWFAFPMIANGFLLILLLV